MALRHLSLRDFVIVPTLELPLASGFSCLTGETGAGKSILIDALQLVLGGRGDAMWVREGQPRCDISAEFDAPAAAADWLQAAGFEPEPDTHTLLLRRSIDANGRSRAWVNGTPATLSQLRELSQWLVDIHGQHAWQGLTQAASVRALLDAYAGLDPQPLHHAWQAWREADAAVQAARSAQDALAQERERLLWQIAELDKLNPADGEWDELSQRHKRLSNAQALLDAAQAASAALEGADSRRGSGSSGALPALTHALQQLEAQAGIEPEFAAIAEVLQSCLAQAEDAARSLHAYWRRADLEPEQLAQLDERMGQWLGLARRFRRPPEDLPALLTQWRQQLAALDARSDLDALQARADQLHQDCLRAAHAISAQRQQAAPQLAQAVTAAMQDLGMAGSRFEVALLALPALSPHGLEAVVFQIAAHSSAAPRPIDRVASGGELSRLALAIAVTTSALGSVGTLVFDEVDSGVGGAVAATVGRLLQRLGHDRQVLCVTHLPQVAACADQHLHVRKQTDASGAPTSQVSPLNAEQRLHEIARMLGGDVLTGATLAHAHDMLAHAANPANTNTSGTTGGAGDSSSAATSGRKTRKPR